MTGQILTRSSCRISLSLFLTHTHSLFLTHSRTLSHTLSHSLSLSLSHTHTHTHSLSLGLTTLLFFHHLSPQATMYIPASDSLKRIQFCVNFKAEHRDYWDSAHGHNYTVSIRGASPWLLSFWLWIFLFLVFYASFDFIFNAPQFQKPQTSCPHKVERANATAASYSNPLPSCR